MFKINTRVKFINLPSGSALLSKQGTIVGYTSMLPSNNSVIVLLDDPLEFNSEKHRAVTITTSCLEIINV